MFLQLITIILGRIKLPHSKWFGSLCTLHAVRPSGINVVNIRYACHFCLDQPASFFDQTWFTTRLHHKQPGLAKINHVHRKPTRFTENQPGLPKINQVSPKPTRFTENQPGISTKNQKNIMETRRTKKGNKLHN